MATFSAVNTTKKGAYNYNGFGHRKHQEKLKTNATLFIYNNILADIKVCDLIPEK